MTIISPDGIRSGGLAEFWRGRELLRFLAWRDIKVRYKQTALGAAWAVIQPVVAMAIFTLVFGRLAKIPSNGAPYAAFSYSGLILWTYFSVTVGTAANSLVESQALITKVYFPRVLIPVAPALANLVDLAIASVVLVALMAVLGVVPSLAIVLMPLLIADLVVTTVGLALLLAAVNVRYRDVRYALPFVLQIWLFATPVAYPSSLFSPGWRVLYGLNPMSGLIESFRWAVLGTVFPGWQLATSVFVSVALFFIALRYFRRTESVFADIV